MKTVLRIAIILTPLLLIGAGVWLWLGPALALVAVGGLWWLDLSVTNWRQRAGGDK